MSNIDCELDLVQEKQEERSLDERIENRMYGDLEFCIEQKGGLEAIESLKKVLDDINHYGHEISMSELMDNLDAR